MDREKEEREAKLTMRKTRGGGGSGMTADTVGRTTPPVNRCRAVVRFQGRKWSEEGSRGRQIWGSAIHLKGPGSGGCSHEVERGHGWAVFVSAACDAEEGTKPTSGPGVSTAQGEGAGRGNVDCGLRRGPAQEESEEERETERAKGKWASRLEVREG
jgi:hypothetical protein